MVTQKGSTSRSAFEAIADPRRRVILDHLAGGELCAGDLAQKFSVSRPAIARHVRILKQAGLVKERREAQKRIYSLRSEGLKEVDRWLQSYRLFWSARLVDLKNAIEEDLREQRADKKGKKSS